MQNSGSFIDKGGLYYLPDEKGHPMTWKPWLGDTFSFLYDFIMKSSIFPKKFNGDINRHYEILRQYLQSVHHKRVLELACGSGSAVHFLPNDNQYTGIDISPGLLKRAMKTFRENGFHRADFYVTPANSLPFADHGFDVVLCVLSLNFFSDAKLVFKEIKRVISPDGSLVCCVPVPERKLAKNTIRGNLYSKNELETMCRTHRFDFKAIPDKNGALLYFTAKRLAD